MKRLALETPKSGENSIHSVQKTTHIKKENIIHRDGCIRNIHPFCLEAMDGFHRGVKE